MNISAIIPIYNGKKYLREAVESVICQTLLPIELILIDDGSTDNSLSEVQDIIAPFPIHIYKQANAGQSSARNHGINVAKGDFVALLDQDDIWYPKHLEELSSSFLLNSKQDTGWVYSNVDQVDQDLKIITPGLLNFCSFNHPQNSFQEMISMDMHILPASTFIRKEALLSVGLFDERLSGYEDDDMFLRLYLAGWKSIYLSNSLSMWRIHSNNSGTSTGFKSRRIYSQKIMQMFPSGSYSFNSSELIGERFFNISKRFYLQYFNAQEYKRCKELYKDMYKYRKLAPLALSSWKYKMAALKYPRICATLLKVYRMLKKINLLSYCLSKLRNHFLPIEFKI